MTPLLEDGLKIIMGSFRIGGLLVSMPIFGTPNVSPIVKFILAVALSSLLMPFVQNFPSSFWTRNDTILLMAAREIGIGIVVGFSARFIFLLISMSLEFGGMQMGFAIATFFDPQNNSQISVIAQMGVVLSILFFFGANFHHHIFVTLAESYRFLPMGLPDWQIGGFISNIMSFFAITFETAIRLSMPMMATMLIINLVMGVISRTSPQMNLFFNITFIVNILAGIFLVINMLPWFFFELRKMVALLFRNGFGLMY